MNKTSKDNPIAFARRTYFSNMFDSFWRLSCFISPLVKNCNILQLEQRNDKNTGRPYVWNAVPIQRIRPQGYFQPIRETISVGIRIERIRADTHLFRIREPIAIAVNRTSGYAA